MSVDVLKFLDRRQLELGPAAETGDWRHWRVARDDGNIAWLLLDCENASVNTLNVAVLEELDRILAELESQPPRALVLRSAKVSGFCAGADIGMFRGLYDELDAKQRLHRGHAIVDHLDELPFTTIAVVHGACLGGGLELALACNYRIAVEGAKFGFPEVLLGLHPGLGGTFRSTRLVNPIQAMTLMLTGKTIPASLAKKQGLIDTVVPERHVKSVVANAAVEKHSRASSSLYGALLEKKWVRPLVARRLIAETEKKVSADHYPAPYNLIDLWQQHGGNRQAMQMGEIESFSRLVASTNGQNLVRVFFLREALARAGKDKDCGIAHVHVVGAGTMGGDIAAWCALKGFRVTLGDQDNTMIAGAVGRATQLCRRQHRSRAETRDVLDRLVPDISAAGVSRADLVIEAVPENLDIKRSVYKDLEMRMKPGAILATNTSSIPLEELRNEVADPGRFLGLHFFNPVAKMELVEVVKHDAVRDEVFSRAAAFVGAIGRLPVPVKSAPGFLVNRILTPYLLEAILLMDEGVAAENLDKAAEDFGMPMGPVELADQVGLDICIAVGDMLREKLDSRMPEIPRWVRDKVEQGHTGRKAGRGFYQWGDSGAEKGRAEALSNDILDRMILPMLNACVACLSEAIVGSEDVLDGAGILGPGYAPFRGGPMHYIRQRGIDDVRSAMEKLAAAHGDRFAPDTGWESLAAT